MSFLYKKEIIDGVSSTRKLLGIPIYRRTDQDGIINKRFFGGIWRIEISQTKKRFYLFGGCVGEEALPISVETFNILYEENRRTLEELCVLTQKFEGLLSLQNSVNGIKNQLNTCYAETSNLKNLIQCQELHKKTFGPYRNAFRGKEVVLVASGPTAARYEPIEGAIHVGVNNACLLENVKLDYLFCQDFYMDDEKKEKIVSYRKGECKKFFGRIPDNRIEACRNSKDATHVRRCPRYLIDEAEASEYYVYDYRQNRMAYDIEKEPLLADGIAFSALQFILHAHPRKIYLVGCDCSSGFFYSSTIVFNNEYMVNMWKKCKAYIDEFYPDIEMVSINPVGLVGLFKDECDEAYLIQNR